MKSEPEEYSIDNLKADTVEAWTGIRNYQVRNMFRDEFKVGDLALFYHSNAKEIGIAGIAKISKEAYPDFTAWDKKDEHYDARIENGNPRWQMVDIQFVKKFPEIITLEKLKAEKKLQDMLILRKGNRLSVTPVTKKEFDSILNINKNS